MADRFSLLRLDEPGQSHKQGNGDVNGHSGMHMRDLSVLEEGDEEEDDLPVQPWGRRERTGADDATMIPDGMSKEEFMRIRAQEGNSLFSGKQRTFKFKAEEGNCTFAWLECVNKVDIDRQYSSSSISSKSPHSPGFEYHPPSSHTSATSSIIFSSPRPPQASSKAANVLGFDFGLAESSKTAPQAPPSPTSTVYEVIDSPTVPDYLLAEDETTTVDLVRDHLRRPPTAQTQAPPPSFHEAEAHYPTLRRKRSKDSWRTNTETIFKVDDGDNDSLFWDENGVFAYYGQNGNGIDEEEQLVMGEQWVRTLHMGEQSSKAPPKSPKSPKSSRPPKSPKPGNGHYRNSNGAKTAAIAKLHRPARQSLFDDMHPTTAALNVKTNVTILKSSETFPSKSDPVTARGGRDSPLQSLNPYKVAHSVEYQSAVGYEGHTANEISSPKQVRQRSSSERSAHSQSPPENKKPINTDVKYITPEMPSMSIFPNTPPPSVSPSQSAFAKPHVPLIPDQSMTPPSNTERKPPTASVMKALRERSISAPTLQHMTATVPTIPIVRMGDDKLEKIRNERRKTRRGRSPPERRPRKAMLEDEPDDIGAASPGPFTRRKTSPPAVATRGEPRRRETTAGSVLFDESLRDRAPSPSANLFVGHEYSAQLPSPHLMGDNPYQPVAQQQSRHRRKVSRQDIDPVTTHSSPAILNQWDGHPKRRMNGAIDPGW